MGIIDLSTQEGRNIQQAAINVVRATRTESKSSIAAAPARRKAKREAVKRGVGAKVLDVVAATLLEPKTFITKGPLAAGRVVAGRRVDISQTKDISKALDVVGEAITSTVIAGAVVLGAANPAAAAKLLSKAIPVTLKGKFAALTVGGILITSKSARDLVFGIVQDPTKFGREAGLLVDKAVAGEDVGGIKEALKTAGFIGAGVAVVAGGAVLVKKLLGGRSTKVPDTAINTPSQVTSSIALPTTPIPDALTPLSEVPVILETPTPEPSGMPGAEINIKVINKPQINVAVAMDS